LGRYELPARAGKIDTPRRPSGRPSEGSPGGAPAPGFGAAPGAGPGGPVARRLLSAGNGTRTKRKAMQTAQDPYPILAPAAAGAIHAEARADLRRRARRAVIWAVRFGLLAMLFVIPLAAYL